MLILALDPGPVKTAWIWLQDGVPGMFGHDANDVVLAGLALHNPTEKHVLVIESIASYGMPVGAEVFDTCRWEGRFEQAAFVPVLHMKRTDVKLHLCNSVRAKDANVRQALIDRFGGKVLAIGNKKNPGPCYGISGDVWASLGVACTWYDQYGKN